MVCKGGIHVLYLTYTRVRKKEENMRTKKKER